MRSRFERLMQRSGIYLDPKAAVKRMGSIGRVEENGNRIDHSIRPSHYGRISAPTPRGSSLISSPRDSPQSHLGGHHKNLDEQFCEGERWPDPARE